MESEIKSYGSRKSSPKKEETKNFDIKKMPFYNPELLSKRKVIINTSTSKEMYSFPTTKRFEKNSKDDSSFFYNIPSSFNKRSTSFGFGKKVIFSDKYQYPGPGTYNHLGINTKGRYAISDLPNTQQNKFGNEERFKKLKIAADTPAPNSYYPESMTKGNGIIYNSKYITNLGKSMGQRLTTIGEKIITPGPGSYKYMNINKYGRYPDSTLSNSIQNKFGNEIRFKKIENNGNPGPNAYHPESMIKGNGIIYNSRYHTNLGKTKGLKLNDLNKSVTPGPGAYEFFSDFEGFYKYGKSKNKSIDQASLDEKEKEKEIDKDEGSNEGTSNSIEN